jgi:TM2 domain-containing membrane protein YozV
MYNIVSIYRNGYDHTTALMLSVFLGMFGIDRFYLGYPAIGWYTLVISFNRVG